MPVIKWILYLMIVLGMSSNVNSQNPIPTKQIPQVTISELAARNALKYKADAEFFYRQSVHKDTIIVAQDSIIQKQKRKLFWKNVEIWGWRTVLVITAFKILK